jgi:hypothetical protein
MRIPSHLLKLSTIRAEPYMAAMAVVAVSMFVGAWVIGPAITRNTTDVSPAVSEARPTTSEMIARPDPFPYRSPTPAFDTSGPPSYAAAAKQKAQAEVDGRGAYDDDGYAERPPAYTGSSRSSRHYRAYDRHRVY